MEWRDEQAAQGRPSFFARAMMPIVTARAGASFFRRVMHRSDLPLLRLTPVSEDT